MILTCPECATRYFVADGAGERTVRCAECGATWRANPPETPSEAPDREAAAAPQAPSAAVADPGARSAPGEALPRLYRQRVEARKRTRRAMTAGAIWGSAAAAVVVLLLLAIVARQDLVRAWPRSASAFAAVGLPVNAVGLEFEGLTNTIGFEDGAPAIMVAGQLRNVENRAVTSPPLRVTLLDGADKVVATRISRPADPVIPAGETRRFEVRMLNPPQTTESVEVGFVVGGREALEAGTGPTPRVAEARTGSSEAAAGRDAH